MVVYNKDEDSFRLEERWVEVANLVSFIIDRLTSPGLTFCPRVWGISLC